MLSRMQTLMLVYTVVFSVLFSTIQFHFLISLFCWKALGYDIVERAVPAGVAYYYLTL